MNEQDVRRVKAGDSIRINAQWRANRRLLPVKYAEWGDWHPATGDEGTVTAHTSGERLWVCFGNDAGSLPVHYDECALVRRLSVEEG